MKLRLTQYDDLDAVLEIIEQAKQYFKVNQIPQWQNGVPSKKTIEEDIVSGNGYVLVEEDEIIGICALFFEDDPAYKTIQEGRWLNDYEYVVIHRMAIKQNHKGHGYGSNMIEQIEQLAKEKGIFNLRIDTHKDNYSMQRLIAKNKFTYCGIVTINDNGEMAERLAYQKEL